jgi:hypothetical protein
MLSPSSTHEPADSSLQSQSAESKAVELNAGKRMGVDPEVARESEQEARENEIAVALLAAPAGVDIRTQEEKNRDFERLRVRRRSLALKDGARDVLSIEGEIERQLLGHTTNTMSGALDGQIRAISAAFLLGLEAPKSNPEAELAPDK